ncbi:TIGR03620 family F420-dependent LLM class oxidoreductase [Amycolatopsis granulosa]|uniref:TIGR03620 family F420-dependent LLM class oxidoreductase n=1 Tax=Amycolatopsis granulosa TaxID=185684 RepID=UPI001422D449|nr:TIGR03620 family F420-dependent LLM class oxidoreductase [Amycolatopsis granulosa]NIH84955.1 putative F420-dependent oxidoreductase [Amycolatopsis granulosa]
MKSIGVWLFGGYPTTVEVEREQLARIDALGYASVWMGETIGGRDAFVRSAVFLGATSRITVGTGIANAWARPAPTAQAAARSVSEAHPGRFVLGIGIGHPYQAESTGQSYAKPLTAMRDYLSRMDEEAATNPPAAPFPRVLAAIGPKMLELSRDATDGAHPFAMPVEHTAFARKILGPGKLLIPHQAVLLSTDPARARAIAREMARQILQVKAYAKAWRDFGYGDEVTDRLADALVAWGDEETIARRVREQLDAGADQVLLSPTGVDLPGAVDQLARLTPALAALTALPEVAA